MSCMRLIKSRMSNLTNKLDGWMVGLSDSWMNGQMDGKMGGQMNGQTDKAGCNVAFLQQNSAIGLRTRWLFSMIT